MTKVSRKKKLPSSANFLKRVLLSPSQKTLPLVPSVPLASRKGRSVARLSAPPAAGRVFMGTGRSPAPIRRTQTSSRYKNGRLTAYQLTPISSNCAAACRKCAVIQNTVQLSE